jgi:sirohydrochlorin ferrochelatase
MSTTGYIVFAHGSSVESANQAVRDVTRELSRCAGMEIAEAAFLEGGQPDLAGAVQKLADRDIRHMVVIPYFLTLGLHLRRDLPRLVESVKRSHPGVHIEVREPLDGHPALIAALLDRAQETA